MWRWQRSEEKEKEERISASKLHVWTTDLIVLYSVIFYKLYYNYVYMYVLSLYTKLRR